MNLVVSITWKAQHMTKQNVRITSWLSMSKETFLVIIMIIISNQSPNHSTVILILGISWSCHRHNFGKESLLFFNHREFFLLIKASELLHRLSEHCPCRFSCNGRNWWRPSQVKHSFDTDQIDLSDWRKKYVGEKNKQNWMLAKKLNMHSFQWQDLKRDIIGKKKVENLIFLILSRHSWLIQTLYFLGLLNPFIRENRI